MGGGGVGGNATPTGPGAARGRQEGRGPISPSGWCQSSPQRSLDPPTRRTDSAPDRRTRAGAGGRPSSWVGSRGRASRLDAPGPPRAARAHSRLSHGQVSARVGRGGGSAAREQTGRSLGPAAGDPEPLSECFVTRCRAQRRARARCGTTADLLGGGAECAGGLCATHFAAADSWAPQGKTATLFRSRTPPLASALLLSLFPQETRLLFQRTRPER